MLLSFKIVAPACTLSFDILLFFILLFFFSVFFVAIFLFIDNYFTLDVLVPEFLMPYNPSCGGMGPCLNNLQEQTDSAITACAVVDIRYYLVLPPGQKTV